MEPSKAGESADNEHTGRVAAWFDRVARGLPADRLLDCFEAAFKAVWLRAHVTLGDVTLKAIADRVIHSASAEFPVLAPLRVGDGGLDFQALRERSADLRTDHLEAGIQFVLAEFLSVLGGLTAEILSPALHQELAKVAREDACTAEADQHSDTDRPSGQGAKENPE